MNKLLIVLGVACSFSVNAMDVSQANEAVSHAERNYSAAVGSYKSTAYQLGNGVVGSTAESQLKDAAAARSQAYADQRSAIQNQQSQSISNYGIKTNSAGNPDSLIAGVKQDPTGSPVTMMSGTKNDPTGTPVTMIAGTKVNPAGNSVINVAASTLAPSTKVNVNGKVVNASTLKPSTQVQVAFVSAFTTAPRGGNNQKSASHSASTHDNRGQENAHSHAFGGHGYGADNSRSEGFGGHSQFH